MGTLIPGLAPGANFCRASGAWRGYEFS